MSRSATQSFVDEEKIERKNKKKLRKHAIYSDYDIFLEWLAFDHCIYYFDVIIFDKKKLCEISVVH